MPKVITEDTVYPGGKVWALAIVDDGVPTDFRILAVSLTKVEKNAREDLETICGEIPGETLLLRIPYSYVLEEMKEVPVIVGRSKTND